MKNCTKNIENSRFELSNDNLNISVCHSEKPFSKFLVGGKNLEISDIGIWGF